MIYWTYITDHCRKEAQNHGYISEVAHLAEKIETIQSLAGWEKFPPPYIKKSLGKKGRLIAEQKKLNDRVVVCFTTFLIRGQRDYDKKFLDDQLRDDFCQKLSPSDEEILDFLNSRQKEEAPSVPEPSTVEYGYLIGFDQINSADYIDLSKDGIIYESRQWVDRIVQPDSRRLLPRYFDILYHQINEENAQKIVLWNNTRSAGVLFRYFPEQNSIFLVAPLNSRTNPSDVEKLKVQYSEILNLENHSIDKETLIRRSGRSYPALVSVDEYIWSSIQENAEGNLSLSPEESHILDTILHPKSNGTVYPLFINGRPGSGKSTILQYLFAEHLYIHLKKDVNNRLNFPPLYLTYSERLLQAAKSSVKIILKCNSKMLVEGGVDLDDTRTEEVFQISFGEFHKFLLDLLSPDERRKFQPTKRVDFTEFRRLWQSVSKGDAELRRLSPELVWHVLRTYIKGMRNDVNNYFDPDAYKELPIKRKTVKQETFEKLYNRVWEKWYKTLMRDEGVWDDQDLTRTILNLENVNLSRYPVVFCDEAQDFTDNELDLILQLSLFSKRNIPPSLLHQVAFAFAGDPFQTLNPTGFDWNAVQAGFHERIVQELDKTSQANLEFNYKELSYNYRSTKHIVGFCNLLQLLRGILFDIKNLKPQFTWFDDDESPMPVYFDVDNSICQEKLEEQTELVIILPCQEGEEDNYVQTDPVLNQIAAQEGEVRNFLSSMSAKGLEFSRVVLYKFGDDYVNNYSQLLDPLKTNSSHSQDSEILLPFEYYMNRLYVAASRAKKRLIIVDSKQAIQALWNNDNISDTEKLVESYAQQGNNRWSIDNLSFVQVGFEGSWSEDRDDPEELGELLREAGTAEKDPYKLKLASANFRRASKSNKKFERAALECDAIRFEWEASYQKAGEIYLQLGQKDKALNCFWRGRKYHQILNNQQFANTPEQRAADFVLNGSKSAAGHESFLQFLYEAVQGVEGAKIRADDQKQWIGICNAYVASATEIQNGEKMDWLRVYNQLEFLKHKGMDIEESISYGTIAFRAKQYEDAVRIWENYALEELNQKNYHTAKAHVSKFPEKLQWLSKIGKDDKIVGFWYQNNKKSLPSEYIEFVVNAFINLQKYEEALKFLKKYPREKELERIFKVSAKRNNSDLIISAASELIKLKIRLSKWQDAIRVVTKSRLKNNSQKKITAVLLTELAMAEQLSTESTDNKRKVSDYLNDAFIQSPWEGIVDFRIVGSAIERADKIIDSLEFYESVWRTHKISTDEEGQTFAKERWIKQKHRMADYTAGRGYRDNAKRHRDEADRYSQSWGIDPKDLPEFPDVSVNDIQSTADAQPEVKPSIDDKQKMVVQASLSSGMSPEDIVEAFPQLHIEIIKQIQREMSS